ncbi:hypothetical protein SLEP1_g23276 [Rubroshorea leprosula]|uniref:Transposase (putative) gypsy type domain-containing protein n=1 Tax=Rubroshorea leprosula TaxID=152421 RepID=A0AAV5JI08_9ROSI|nr:hypothetical protein SLEP1_g23276 [Rubroshorea leprosula]
MASFHDAQEFQGNQGEDEEVDVISTEPIVMIVPPELQDSLRIATPESSTSSSAGSGSEDHRPSTSSDSRTEETPSETEGAEEAGCSVPTMSTAAKVVLFEGWESKVLSVRLDNLRKAPKTLPAGFKFKAALYHEVADGAATVKGYKKLEEMVRRYQIPRTILIRARTPNERVCSVSRMGWVLVYVDHFDAGLCFPLPGLIFDVLAEYELVLSQLTPNSIKFIIGFMLLCERLGMPAKAVVFKSLFLCRLCPSTSGTRWYYISGREKMMIFTNIRNKLTSGDVDLKNRLLDYVKARGLVDLEALVTPDQIALLGFVDVANLNGEGNVREHKAQGAGELDPVPSVNPALTSGRPLHLGTAHSTEVPARHKDHVPSRDVPQASAREVAEPAREVAEPAREVAEPAPASSSVAGPRIAYPNGFSYANGLPGCDAAGYAKLRASCKSTTCEEARSAA